MRRFLEGFKRSSKQETNDGNKQPSTTIGILNAIKAKEKEPNSDVTTLIKPYIDALKKEYPNESHDSILKMINSKLELMNVRLEIIQDQRGLYLTKNILN